MKIFSYIKSHAVLSSAIAIVAVIGMVIAGRVAKREIATLDTGSNIKKITLVEARNFQNINSRIEADGIVESVSQVELRSQISAPIVALNVSIGDTVNPGETIAILQNADVRALLDQAKAGLKSAEGQYVGSGITLESARRGAIENIRSAYLIADEAVNIDLNSFLYERTSSNPSLSTFIIDRDLGDRIRNLNLEARNSFTEWKGALDRLGSNSHENEIQEVIDLSQKNLSIVSKLLDEVSDAITESITGSAGSDFHSTLITWQSTVTGLRNSINTSEKQLTTAEANLSGAQATVENPAEASVSGAEASIRNLEAQLAKTIITSPIGGRIGELPIRAGELAQPGALIATVIGGGGLQVKAYASGEDLPRLKEGANVIINNSIQGKVISVAPSVSQTNRKVEFKVAITSENPNLVIGQSVTVYVDGGKTLETSNPSIYLLPIQNVKIVPGNAYVFTVDSQDKLVRHPVTIGKIEGDFVQIISGITSDMKIVTPVYELEEGEKVEVQ
jgi:RND family efflux transporter MFP subunit